jgi:hypothetical protein
VAEKYPLATGLWSDAANWNGGTKPLVADDVHANNFIVTIDESISVNSLRGTAGAVAVANGQFLTSGTVVIDVADAVYGGNSSTGTLRMSSGATLNGNATLSTVASRASVFVLTGAVMNGDAIEADGVAVDGGLMNGNAVSARSRTNAAVTVSNGGEMIGTATGDARGTQQVFCTNSGIFRGTATGGTVNNSFGVHCQKGALHIGDSYAGTSAQGTELREGAIQIGNAFAGSANIRVGTNITQASLFFGNATGGSGTSAHGIAVANGFAQVGVATGNTSGAFGVSATSFSTVLIGSEVGSFAKSLDSTVITDNSRYPFTPSGGSSRPVNPFQQQVIG